MNGVKKITDGIYWIGGSDRRLERFENIFPIPEGVSYNSYFIDDEKTAVFDTADISISDQYLENLKDCLEGKKLDYLVVLHMEPDHCALISTIAGLYPEVTVVGNAKTFTFMEQFFPESASYKKLEVKEGDTLSTGKHVFKFVTAPMVHWPEVLFAYDEVSKALLSADAFGTFGALDGGIFADEYDFEKDFLDSARRYYANIVGKYGMQVQAALKKAATIDIEMILPLHGPVWRKDISWFLDKYQKWSTYEAETDDIAVIYGSLYGHTKSAAEAVASLLREKTGKNIKVFDVSGTDVSYLIGEVWRCSKLVLMCPTYNNGIYPPMEAFLNDMNALGVQNRIFALAQNGTWAPVTVKLMTEKLQGLKNVTILEESLTIKSALHKSDCDSIESFTESIAKA
ncbi:FprA family A-type flavoprotein [Butyrivibrio sp. YAB3001]|uniref:FprA family A-type flavoprotein n=1 Tax=Butyrivibrio sp. YAB3001 TaxID=1520812 RepID=UPI0008F63E87|nr:FprA family A-type flavoprotein [Butyrivibrio sp. YAB3001]SFC89027.1 Flavorubredoxin [Butyrivibrio sp. YAB3001]